MKEPKKIDFSGLTRKHYKSLAYLIAKCNTYEEFIQRLKNNLAYSTNNFDIDIFENAIKEWRNNVHVNGTN